MKPEPVPFPRVPGSDVEPGTAGNGTSLTSLRIGTRGSKLALAQAGLVKELLGKARPGLHVELLVIKTTGDDFSAGQAPQLRPGQGGRSPEAAVKGFFVKEIDEALLDGRVDLAVHSVKDMEAELPEGLVIGAVLKREDPRDALVTSHGGSLKELPGGTRVGASSLRRQAQLKRLRRDLELLPVRGNVDTRLRKLDAGEYDALILAAAGLKRLGLEGRISGYLDTASFLPAAGQGALAVEIRKDRKDLAELLRIADDPATHAEVEAERSFLKALGASCRVPVGALAHVSQESLTLEGAVFSPDGLKAVRRNTSGPAKAARRVGAELASHLRAAGADRLLFGSWAEKR